MNMSIRTSRDIGEKLKEFRKLRGLTQEQLAERVEVTFQQIQKYENGHTRLNTDKLQIVAQALNVPVSAIFDEGFRDEKLLSEQEQKLLKGFRSLVNPDIREFIVNILLK
jgi:transcriptional regulator with XRE-family HTH domain